ncbi:MAG: hypothetical protein DBX40_00565 [Clostridiales bacterium]|nr:MAG: hypothetical protein DBX40_00565 [Clostridiales bacterium]
MPAFIAGIFLVHVLQALPGAECAPGSFFEHGNIPATMAGIFSVPWVQKQAQPYSAGACGLLPQAIQSRRHCACLRFKKACGRRKTTKLTIYCEYTILEVM